MQKTTRAYTEQHGFAGENQPSHCYSMLRTDPFFPQAAQSEMAKSIEEVCDLCWAAKRVYIDYDTM